MLDDEYRAMFELEERLWWYSGMRAISAAILDGVTNLGEASILDVGCGTGYAMKWLQELVGGSRVFGVDSSARGAELWKQRSIDRASLAGADQLPFGDAIFDLLTCFDVVYQFDTAKTGAALREFNRVLRRGRALLIREPAYDWLRGSHDRAVGTRHRFTRRELVGLLSSSGFKIRRATYANTLLLPLALPHRIFSRRGGSDRSDVRRVSPLLNSAFGSALRLEARMLRRVSFPFGLSVVVVAEKV